VACFLIAPDYPLSLSLLLILCFSLAARHIISSRAPLPPHPPTGTWAQPHTR